MDNAHRCHGLSPQEPSHTTNSLGAMILEAIWEHLVELSPYIPYKSVSPFPNESHANLGGLPEEVCGSTISSCDELETVCPSVGASGNSGRTDAMGHCAVIGVMG